MTMRPTTQTGTQPSAAPASASAVTVALLILLGLSPVAAGSLDDPEIHDPEGDTAPFMSLTEGAAEALDVTGIWFTETNQTLTAHWQVVQLTASGATDRFAYHLMFSAKGTQVLVIAWRQAAESSIGAGLWVGDGVYPCAHTIPSDQSSEGKVRFDDATSRIEIVFPRRCEGEDSSLDLAAGVSITNPRAMTGHCNMVPVNTCVTYTVVDDTEAGRTFSFPDGGGFGEQTLDAEPATVASANGSSLAAILLGLAATAAGWSQRRGPRGAGSGHGGERPPRR